MNRDPYHGKKNLVGVTIVELMIALFLSTILSTSVYFVWNHIVRHTITKKRQTALQLECNRIIDQIVTQLQRTESILNYSRYSLSFTTDLRTDTINYSYDGTSLSYNDIPIRLTTSGASVHSFSIINSNEYNDQSPYLFIVSISLIHLSGDTASTSATICIHRSPAKQEENMFSW